MTTCIGYLWSNRTGERLWQIQADGVNLLEMKACLGVKSMKWKTEMRVLMENDRLIKAIVSEWYEGLERKHKKMEMKIKWC